MLRTAVSASEAGVSAVWTAVRGSGTRVRATRTAAPAIGKAGSELLGGPRVREAEGGQQVTAVLVEDVPAELDRVEAHAGKISGELRAESVFSLPGDPRRREEGLEKKGGAWQHAPLDTTDYLVVSGDESVGGAVSGAGGSGCFRAFFDRLTVRSGWIPNSTSVSLW